MFLIRFLILIYKKKQKQKQTTSVFLDVGVIQCCMPALLCLAWLSYSHSWVCCVATELLSVQCYGLLTQSVFWVVFVTVFVSRVIYCFVF